MKLKKCMILALIALAASLPVAGQTEEPIKEAVSVVNIEVPVRVFFDGQSVAGLGKDDFLISEGGKAQQINGFYVIHKKINSDSETLPAEPPAGRYFVLVFRIYKFDEQLEKGLLYLFDNIFRPEDQVFVMANNRTLMIDRLGSDTCAQEQITKLLRSESQAARDQMLSSLHSIEQSLDMTKFKLSLRSQFDLGPDYLMGFLQSYLQTWQDFKRRFLTLELDKFYYFSRHLERIKREKWVLNFYQLEQFPQIAFDTEMQRRMDSYISSLSESQNPTLIAQSRSLTRVLQNINMEMKVTKNFPAEEVSKLFYKVNATFHSFFMRAFFDAGNPDLEFRSVATDIENSLRALTQSTGGTLTASNEVDSALAAVSEKADDYYIMTYEPSNPKKVGKIKVTVRDKKYSVVYDNNIRADYINDYLKKREAENPAVKITGLSFAGKKLAFVISDFSLAKIKGETSGMLAVRIRVKNAQEQIFFDQNKSLQSSKKNVSLSLGFDFLAAGKYDIIVDVLDQVSGKTATAVAQPLIE